MIDFSDGKVHLWLCDTSAVQMDDLAKETCDAVLPESEITAVYRFKFDADKKMALASRLLMRDAISKFASTPHQEIEIERDKSGKKPIWKPRGSPKEFMHFNVGHDNDMVVMGASLYLVGVDIMKYQVPRAGRSVADFFSSLRGTFQESEWEYIRGDPDEQKQLKRFMWLWTMKEAYVKCFGTGLYVAPERLRCEFPDDKEAPATTEAQIFVDGVPQEKFTFFHKEAMNGQFVVCICLAPPPEAHELYRSQIAPEYLERFMSAPPLRLESGKVEVHPVDLQGLMEDLVLDLVLTPVF